LAVLSVPITLDKERNLKFGFSAMMALEKQLSGKSFMDIINEIQTKPTITLMINVVWAGLLHEDKTLTPEKVAKILDSSDVEDLLGVISKAMDISQKKNSTEGNAVAGEAE
jgi:hypothetical protein